MYVTLMDTTHFRFIGLGETEEKSQRAVALAFSQHLVEYSPGETDEQHEREHFLIGIDLQREVHPEIDDESWTTEVGDYYGYRTVMLLPGQAARRRQGLRKEW